MKRAYIVNVLSIFPIGSAAAMAYLLFSNGDYALAVGAALLLVAFVAAFMPMLQSHMWDESTVSNLIVFENGNFVPGFNTDTLQLSPMELTFLTQVSADSTLRSTAHFTEEGEVSMFWVYGKEKVPTVGRIKCVRIRRHCFVYSAVSYHPTDDIDPTV